MENLMNNRLFLNKEKKSFIKLITSILIISIILVCRVLIKIKLIHNEIELMVIFVETFGLILSILACTSFLISYRRIKNNSIFIISLVHITACISIIFQYLNSFNIYNNCFQYYNRDTITSWFLRCVLIFIAVYPNNKVKNFIANNKIKSIIFIFLYMLINTLICKHFNLYTNKNFFIYINIALMIAYFIATINFSLIGAKEKEYFYFVISLSMFIFTIKTVYIFLNPDTSQMHQIIITTALGYLVLITIIAGSFIELILYVNRVKNLNKNLQVFYDLNDNNKHTYLLICNKNREVLYTNDKFKNNYNFFDKKCNHNKNNIEILKGPFRILRPFNEVNTIVNELYSSGQWRGVINVDKDLCIDCSVHIINPKDKNSLISICFKDISNIINKELELEKLKVYNREQTEFISNISHELRTPINIFYSTIQLLDRFYTLESEDFKDVYKKYRKSLHTNCKRMLKLVNNVIDISKIETGILKGDFQYYNIVSIVEDVTSSVKNYAKLKSINIHFDTDCEEFISKCDCSLLERVMLNLLSNAIKFTPENRNIYVNIFEHDNFLDIHIKDEGLGIESKDMKNIFKRFMQSDKSLARKNEGSGIGLSIVKSIIDLHNGHISVESEVNVGSTFKIILPRVGEITDECNIFDIDDYNTALELSDIYEVLS